MAAGGEGAPLVPAFHEAMFRHPEKTRVIVNIGGIANITILPPQGDTAVIGFDTGPGNTLMDDWCYRHSGRRYDKNGRWAASGEVSQELISALLSDSFFSRPPPKALDVNISIMLGYGTAFPIWIMTCPGKMCRPPCAN